MPVGSVAVKERHQPLVLVDTAGLSEEEWLAYRRKGIGGSDVAALLGISPWRTARDLFYDKLNIAVVEDHEDNWVALEMGHLLEPLVAKIFQHRTGYKVYQIKKMFQHPKYPWMLADVDYFVELPDGTTAILEIKTTNYNAKDNWWLDGEETIPAYHSIFDFRIAQRILTGGIAHQADERIAFEHRNMACHQCGVDLHAAQDLPHRGVGLDDLLRQPDREHGDADLRVDDDGFPLVAGQGFCQDAGKHAFPAPRAAPDSNDFSHRKLLSQGWNALDFLQNKCII